MAPDVIWHGVEPFQPDFSHMARTLYMKATVLYEDKGDAAGAEAYQDYRRGERDLFATERVAEQSWQAYRAGERGDPTAP